MDKHKTILDIDLVAAIDQNHGIGTGTAMPWHLPRELKWFQTLTSSLEPYSPSPSSTERGETRTQPRELQDLIDDKSMGSLHPMNTPMAPMAPMAPIAQLETKTTAAMTTPPPSPPSTAVLMGRVTWEALPKSYRPLPDRLNLILSQNKKQELQALTASQKNVSICSTLDEAIATCRGRVQRLFIIGGGRLYEQFFEEQRRRQLRFLYLTEIEKEFACSVFLPPFSKFSKEKIVIAVGEENDLRYRVCRYKMP